LANALLNPLAHREQELLSELELSMSLQMAFEIHEQRCRHHCPGPGQLEQDVLELKLQELEFAPKALELELEQSV
jgi:hypothetical protein